MWTDGECYKYELHQLQNCKNKLKLNETYYVICDYDEDDVEANSDLDDYDYYALFTTFDNMHSRKVAKPTVKVDKEKICRILQLEDSCK